MSDILLLSIAIFSPAALGALSLALPCRCVGPRVGLSVLAMVIPLVVLGSYLGIRGTDGGPVGVEWMPSFNLAWSFHPDRLGMFFAMLVAAVGILIVAYARAYFGPDQSALRRFYPSLLLFVTAMLGVALADNFMLLLLFWELTSISSFLLIGWERDDPPAVRNALQAFLVTGIGGLALLGGLILLGLSTGSWSFSALSGGAVANGQTTAAFVLIFIGAAAKSAQWPLHFWLPGAMAAPTPVSAYLHSATMVKAGVYLLGRLADPMAGAVQLWPILLISIGAITMVLGAYLALRKTDLKLIFAYTTVSQLGLLVCMYGLASFQFDGRPALVWDITQILNHATYKAPLFILAGAVAHIAYTRDVRDLHGFFHAGRIERLLTVLLLLAAYAMASGPLTLGFAAKEFFFYGIYEAYQASGSIWLIAVMAAGVCQGAFNVAIFVRLARTLLGPESGESLEPPHDPNAEEERIAYEDYHAIQIGFWPAMLWAPAVVLLVVQYLGGIAPVLFDEMFASLERTRARFDHLPGTWYFIAHPGVPLAMSVAGMVLGGVLGFTTLWRRNAADWHDRIFPLFYKAATRGGGRVFGLIQNGDARRYLAIVFACLVALVCWAIQTLPTVHWKPTAGESFVDVLPAVALGVFAGAAGLLLPWMKERGGRVMVLGAVGFAVAGIFYIHNAPDVALTQVTIEIASLILFLLALSLLPRTVPSASPRGRLPRLIIAAAVGLTMFWLTLGSAVADRASLPYLNADGSAFRHLGDFFLRNSYAGVDTVGRNSGGGGNNVVNVILVDFRGFDTFGEIIVLALATLGVWTLLRRTGVRRQRAPALASQQELTTLPPGPDRRYARSFGLSSEPLRVVSRLLVPLSLLFALYIFLKGHQTPGGGFVAGLVAAIAIIIHRMAYGRHSARRLLRVRERTLIGVGLLLAIVTGAAPLLLGQPFLTSAFGYIGLPGTHDKVAWATVIGFDLGVFLVVMGVVVGLINSLSEEMEGR